MTAPRLGLSKEVRDFLVKHINSVAQFEALLLLQGDQARVWSVDDLARELRIERDWAAQQLQKLCEAGLAAAEASPAVYRFDPNTTALRDAVAATADAYATRRVAIINAIYSKPIQKLHVFAESFRIRKDQDDG